MITFLFNSIHLRNGYAVTLSCIKKKLADHFTKEMKLCNEIVTPETGCFDIEFYATIAGLGLERSSKWKHVEYQVTL